MYRNFRPVTGFFVFKSQQEEFLIKSAFSDSSKEQKKEVPKIVSMIDKLEKRNVIHKNKAARLKSKLMTQKSS